MNFLNLFRSKKKTEVNEVIYAAISGFIVPIEEVPDVVFSDKIIGDGLAIQPTSNVVCAPIAGTITKLYDTRHAIMIKTDSGLDVFIHFGLNTIDLKGEHLEMLVEVGDKVAQGQPLLQVELEEIERKELLTVTPVVVSNLTDKTIIDRQPAGTEVEAGKTILYRVVSKANNK